MEGCCGPAFRPITAPREHASGAPGIAYRKEEWGATPMPALGDWLNTFRHNRPLKKRLPCRGAFRLFPGTGKDVVT